MSNETKTRTLEITLVGKKHVNSEDLHEESYRLEYEFEKGGKRLIDQTVAFAIREVSKVTEIQPYLLHELSIKFDNFKEVEE